MVKVLPRAAALLDTELGALLNAAVDLIGGAVAQMGERRVRNAEVRGSIPLGSTMFSMS